MDIKCYSLSGEWILARDIGAIAPTPNRTPENADCAITVPHSYEQGKWKYDYAYSKKLSRYHGYVWYYRSFCALPDLDGNMRYRLEFDRVSYICQVYLNGVYLGEHRHSEESFSFDVTDAVSTTGENLLAVRCFEPLCGGEPIDGITLGMIPNGFWAGSENHPNLFPLDPNGGILEDVRIIAVPTLRIENVFVLPKYENGDVRTEVTLVNETGSEKDLNIELRISEHRSGHTVATERISISAPTGRSTAVIDSNVKERKLWELNCPTLYVADILLENGSSERVRFGFREITVKNGFFFLNGKRFILKCAHGTPSAATVIQMKAMGFCAFRSIQQVMPKEVLDLCDELGFLIIEAPLTSWGMRWYENTSRMVEDSLCNMVRAHRNHPCIGAFYLFNELKRKETMYSGANCLPRLRALSPNNLFLLSSGRWDLEYDLGSVSLPYSDKWECLFAKEGNADEADHVYPSRFHVVHNLGMGDLHPYVYVPLDNVAKNWFRRVGEDCKPLFISEGGIGTQEHPDRCYFERLSLGMSKESDSVKEIKAVWDDSERFMTHYGMENVFPFVSDLFKASDRENGKQRKLLFDLIRSNPKINGFSLTSWGTGNEGALEGEGVIKDTVARSMQEGWAPLRWALFADAPVIYENTPFTIEAVLCNEDVLPAGIYGAEAKIKGRNGIVWEKRFDAVYPKDGYGDMPPLAATVLKESLSLPAGMYTLSVRLLEGGCPYGGAMELTVADAVRPIDEPLTVTALGISEDAKQFLCDRGIKVVDGDSTNALGSTVFVGAPKPTKELIQRLEALLERGSTVVFLDPEFFACEDVLPLLKKIAGEDARCETTIDWLYHFDTVHIRHPLFSNIHDEGLLELDTFFELYPRLIFTNTKKADRTLAASIRTDAGQCATSLTVGEYRVGKGAAVINGFRVEAALGINPYADRMLLNFALCYGEK